MSDYRYPFEESSKEGGAMSHYPFDEPDLGPVGAFAYYFLCAVIVGVCLIKLGVI